MDDSATSLQPLADYLEPHFGDIYDYNFKGGGQFEVQEWTEDLKEAVKDYLVHRAPEDLSDQMVVEILNTTYVDDGYAQQIDAIIATHEPWQIAHAFHEAAVVATPTLHALIGHLDHWRYEDDRMDASRWLDEHVTDDQLSQMIRAGGIHVRARERSYSSLSEILVQDLEPPALVAAWSEVIGPAPSDLTDDEWALLVPFLPKHPKHSSYPARLLPLARISLNGIFYHLANSVPWPHVPERYGAWTNLYYRLGRYKDRGVFQRMRLHLEDKPEAKRVVEWLRMLEL